MATSLSISILGAITAVIVSFIGAWLANRNSIILQIRKLKEEHYVDYIEAVHNFAVDNDSKVYNEKYVFSRDKLFLIASEDVIKKMMAYENDGITQTSDVHDRYLTELIKAIRKDLKIKDKDFPSIYLRKFI